MGNNSISPDYDTVIFMSIIDSTQSQINSYKHEAFHVYKGLSFLIMETNRSKEQNLKLFYLPNSNCLNEISNQNFEKCIPY